MAAAFELYVDDSGSEPNSVVFFLAGFISTVERWTVFSNEWDSALGIPPQLDYFKMSEAAGFWEQFSRKRGWDEAKRDDRLVTLARIINKYAMLRVSTSLRYDLFKKYVLSLPAVERNLGTDEPYVMLAGHLATVALDFADKKGLIGPIDFVFDKQTGHQEEFLRQWPTYKQTLLLSPYGRRLSRLVGADPIFADEKDRRPLQAADLYAWQARSHYVENHKFPNQKIVVPMSATLAMFRGIPQAHAPMTEDVLARQLDYLVRVGEDIKKANPSLRLIPASLDRKERRKVRRQTKRQRDEGN